MEELTAEEAACDHSSVCRASHHEGCYASKLLLRRLLRCLEGLPIVAPHWQSRLALWALQILVVTEGVFIRRTHDGNVRLRTPFHSDMLTDMLIGDPLTVGWSGS
jgi:hypothetical protein